MDYETYVKTKLSGFEPSGFSVPDTGLPLFDFQDALARWALRLGRSAIFADTGLGKTRMQLAWAHHVHHHTGQPVLILAPLAVAEQTVEEGASIGVHVEHHRDEPERNGIVITNYERLHKFDTERYAGVVLDESSIIKHHDSKTLQQLMDCFRDTPFKLCATATPAPNDWTELGTHAEFLGICTRAEMLSEFFVHDGGETQVWRLKGHAREAFWRWVSSWGALVRNPADLGYEGSRYDLPKLTVQQHTIITDQEAPQGLLFAMEAQTLMERRNARRDSVEERVQACAEMVNSNAEPWVVWCELNTESEALTKAIDGAIEVRGSMTTDQKEKALSDFAHGRARVIVTKPSIAGFGLNWQHCNSMAFVGVTDSFESYYQSVRRCWRFGQRRPVTVHIFASELEGAVVANLQRKERDARAMAESLAAQTADSVRANVLGSTRATNDYNAARKVSVPAFLRGAA
jgi:hypothetical protein